MDTREMENATLTRAYALEHARVTVLASDLAETQKRCDTLCQELNIARNERAGAFRECNEARQALEAIVNEGARIRASRDEADALLTLLEHELADHFGMTHGALANKGELLVANVRTLKAAFGAAQRSTSAEAAARDVRWVLGKQAERETDSLELAQAQLADTTTEVEAMRASLAERERRICALNDQLAREEAQRLVAERQAGEWRAKCESIERGQDVATGALERESRRAVAAEESIRDWQLETEARTRQLAAANRASEAHQWQLECWRAWARSITGDVVHDDVDLKARIGNRVQAWADICAIAGRPGT